MDDLESCWHSLDPGLRAHRYNELLRERDQLAPNTWAVVLPAWMTRAATTSSELLQEWQDWRDKMEHFESREMHSLDPGPRDRRYNELLRERDSLASKGLRQGQGQEQRPYP